MMQRWGAVRAAFVIAITMALGWPAQSVAGQIVYVHHGAQQTLNVMNDNGTGPHAVITNQDGISIPSQPNLFPDSTSLAFQASAPALAGSSGAQSCGYNCVGIYSLIGGTLRRVSPPAVSCAADTSNCATQIDNHPSLTADGHVVYLHTGSLFGLPLCGYYGCTAWGDTANVFLEQSDLGGDTPQQWATPPSSAGNYQPDETPGDAASPVADPADAGMVAYSGLEDDNCATPDECDPVTVDNAAGTTAYNVTDADCGLSSGGCSANNDMTVLGFSPGGQYILVDYGSASQQAGLWVFENSAYSYSGAPGNGTAPILGTGWWVFKSGTEQMQFGPGVGLGGALESDGTILFSDEGDIFAFPPDQHCWGGSVTPTTASATTANCVGTQAKPLTTSGVDDFPTWTSSNAAIDVGSKPSPPGSPTSELAGVTHRGTSVSAKIRCTGASGDCQDIVGLATFETLRGSKVIAVAGAEAPAAETRHKTAIVASKKVAVAVARTRSVKLTINATGMRLLRKFRKLPMLVLVVQGKRTVGAARVTVTLPRAKRRHRR